MSDLGKALSKNVRTRTVGDVIEDYEEQQFYVGSITFRDAKNNGKKPVMVYTTFEEDGKPEFWMTQGDVARLFSSNIKRLQSLVRDRTATGQVKAGDKRRLPGKSQEALLSIRKWRQIVFSYKPFAHCGSIMRSNFDALLGDLGRIYRARKVEVDSTVQEAEVAKQKGTWVPEEKPEEDDVPTVEMDEISDEELERLTTPEKPVEVKKAPAPQPEVKKTPERPLPKPEEVISNDLPPLSVYQLITVKYTDEQILAALKRFDPRIKPGAKIRRTDDGGIALEWEEIT